MTKRILKISASQCKRDYLLPETKISLLLEKSINEMEEMLDWDQRPQLAHLQYPVLDYDQWKMLFWTRIIWEVIFGNNLAIHLKSCSWYLCQLSYVEKKLFPILCLGCCRVQWWLLFCDMRVVISVTPGLPSPLPALSPHWKSVALVVTQGMCPFLGLAVCLWPLCLMWPSLQHRSPAVSTSTSQLLITDPQSTSSFSSHGCLCWPLGSELAKCLLFAVSWREGKF